MTNKTPQWENRFRRKFVSNGYVSMEDGDLFEAKEVKAFITSTLEEVIEKIHECCDGECYHDDCCGKLSCVKAQLRKEFL